MLTVDQHADHPRLYLAGEIDMSGRDDLVAAATGLIPISSGLLVLDFSGVTFCDSSGISALVTIYRRAEQADCRVRLLNVDDPHVRWVLSVSGVDKLVVIDEDPAPPSPDLDPGA
jgi:anti-anti-sigma factor